MPDDPGAAGTPHGAIESSGRPARSGVTGMTMLAADLAAAGRLRPEHTVDTAAAVLWLAMDVRNYDWLVRQRGWPAERFQRWYVETVAAALLTAPAPASAA